MAKFLSNINLETANDIQFKTTAGANAGKISQTGDDLVISNAVGDILLGNGSDDIYIGDGTNAVDIRFEQNMAIFADSSSTRTLTLGGSNTSLVLESPTFNGTITLGATTINNKLTFTTANGYILFDYEPSGDTDEYTNEVPLIKIDKAGQEKTILSRISQNGALQLGHDDTVLISGGDIGDIMKDNWGATSEAVVLAAENGFRAYGFPANTTTWANRNEFRFRSDSATASENGLYIGDGGNTQFIDLSRNISAASVTSTGGSIKAMGGANVYVYDDSDDTKIHFQAKSNDTEGVLQISNGSNYGLIARGIQNAPRLGAYHGGTLDIYGFGNSEGANHVDDDLLAQFNFSGEFFQVNGDLDINGNADISGTLTTATWNGAVIASAYLDSDTAHLSTSQTFTGAKTMQGNLTLDDGAGDTPTLRFINGDDTVYQFFNDSTSDMKLTRTNNGGVDYNFNAHATDHTQSVLQIGGSSTFGTDVTIAGNLTVNGTTVTVDTTNLNVQDKNITLNYSTSDSSASADGAGITIQDAVNSSTDATILWDATNDEFDFSHAINVTGNIGVSGTVDGRDIATDGTKLDGIATSANNYVHPTNAGNKHIPAGGASGNFLKYSSAGTAVWSDVTSTDVGLSNVANVDQRNASNINSGTLSAARLADPITSSTSGSAASLSDISYGQIVIGGESGYTKLDGNAASSNKFLRSRGTGSSATEPAWESIGYNDLSGTVPTWNQNTTGTAAGLSSTLAVSSGGTGATTLAGAGIVLTTSAQTIAGAKTFSGGLILDDGSGAAPIIKWRNGNDDEFSMFNNASGKLIFQQDATTRADLSSTGLNVVNGIQINGSAVHATDTSTSLGTSDTLVPSQNAVKSYVDANVTSGGMTSWSLDSDANSAGTVTNGTTVSFDGGTGISTSRSGTVITITNDAPAGSTHLNSNTTKTDVGLSNVENTALSTYTGQGGALDNQYITNGAGYTTNTGTTTASNTQTFTNKSGNISQWTNDSNYLTDFSGLAQSDIPSDSINTSKLAHGSVGQIIAFTTNGVPTLVSAGSAGQVLTANSGSHPTFQNATGGTNTTYDLTCNQTGSPANDTNPKIVLTGSDSSQDSITITGAGATTVTRTSNSGFTISSTDTNTNTQLSNSQVKAAITASAAADTIISSDELLFLDNSDSDAVKKGDVGDLAAALTDNTGGLTTSSGIIKANVGAGITIDTNKLKIHLNPTNTGLQLDQTNGLSVKVAASGGIAVDASDQLTLNSDITSVDTIYNTALHVGRASNQMHFDFSPSDAVSVFNNTSEEFRFTNAGVFHANGDVLGFSNTISSDRKLKKNIRPLDQYGLDEVLKLKPVMYDWKDKKRRNNNIGFIAQDVQEVIPELVNESILLNGKEGETKLGVEYNKMIAVLTNAIQEQQKQIEELKKLINGNTK